MMMMKMVMKRTVNQLVMMTRAMVMMVKVMVKCIVDKEGDGDAHDL